MGTMPEQDGCAQSWIVFVVIIGSAQALRRFRVDTILDLRPVDAQENNLAAPLNRQFYRRAKRNILECCLFAALGFGLEQCFECGKCRRCLKQAATLQAILMHIPSPFEWR